MVLLLQLSAGGGGGGDEGEASPSGSKNWIGAWNKQEDHKRDQDYLLIVLHSDHFDNHIYLSKTIYALHPCRCPCGNVLKPKHETVYCRDLL